MDRSNFSINDGGKPIEAVFINQSELVFTSSSGNDLVTNDVINNSVNIDSPSNKGGKYSVVFIIIFFLFLLFLVIVLLRKEDGENNYNILDSNNNNNKINDNVVAEWRFDDETYFEFFLMIFFNRYNDVFTDKISGIPCSIVGQFELVNGTTIRLYDIKIVCSGK